MAHQQRLGQRRQQRHLRDRALERIQREGAGRAADRRQSERPDRRIGSPIGSRLVQVDAGCQQPEEHPDTAGGDRLERHRAADLPGARHQPHAQQGEIDPLAQRDAPVGDHHRAGRLQQALAGRGRHHAQARHRQLQQRPLQRPQGGDRQLDQRLAQLGMTGRRACPSLAPAGLGRRLPGHLQHRDDQCGRTARLTGRLNQAHGGGRRRLINLHTDIGVSGDPGHPGGFKVEHRQRRLAAIKLRQHKRCNRVPMATIDAPNTLTKRRMGRKPLSRRHNANQHQMTEAAQIGMTAQGIAANRVPGKHRRRSFLCLTEMSVLRLRRQAPPKSGDFAQRATQAITTARELDRLRVGKKLALTAHARLDCPGRENSQGAYTCQDAAHQRHRDG